MDDDMIPPKPGGRSDPVRLETIGMVPLKGCISQRLTSTCGEENSVRQTPLSNWVGLDCPIDNVHEPMLSRPCLFFQ
jgi:hypothetical protein